MANLETPTADAVLVRCPACKAWPMAVNVVKTAWGFRKVFYLPVQSAAFLRSRKAVKS